MLIHELIHALQVHCVTHGTIETDSTTHLDEAIVEAWATILNLSFLHQKRKTFVHTNSPQDYLHILNSDNYEKERRFALAQASKILKLYKCKQPDDLCVQKLPNLPAIYAYYVYKASLLNDPMRFVTQFWWPTIKKCKSISKKTLDTYVDDSFEKDLQSVRIDPKNNNMRMTLLGDV